MTAGFDIAESLQPVAITSVTADKTSPQPLGTPVTWTCNATGGTSLRYQFWVETPGIGYEIKQAYSTSKTFTMTPTVAGRHTVCVWVKDVNSTKDQDQWMTAGFDIAESLQPVTITSVTADKTSPQLAGTLVTWTCNATGGTSLLYQFQVYTAATGWQTKQAYSVSNTFVWTPTVAGDYSIAVWVKDASSTTSDFDKNYTSDYIITTPISFNLKASGTLNILTKVIWTGDKYVAVGYGGVVLTSTDGDTWNTKTVFQDLYICDIVWAQNLLVAVGYGGIIVSSDGENWTKTYTPSSSYSINGVTYGKGKFVAVDSNGNVISSSNGLSWSTYTIVSQYEHQSYELRSVSCDGEQFIAAGVIYYGTELPLILRSVDGISWTQCSIPNFTHDSRRHVLHSVNWNGNQFVIGGINYCSDSGLTQNVLYSSTDSISWTCNYCNDYSSISSITWNGTQYYSVGYEQNQGISMVYTSTDGAIWSVIGKINGCLRGIACHEGKIVIVGDDGKIYTN